MVALVSRARTGALMHFDRKIFLLDESHGRASRGSGRDRGSMGGRRVCPPGAARVAYLVCSGHGRMERSKVTHHGLVLLLLIGVNGLSMLPEVVEAGELFATVTAKGTFACVFSTKEDENKEGCREVKGGT